jgi:glycerol-3-phosphate dehydrogenase
LYGRLIDRYARRTETIFFTNEIKTRTSESATLGAYMASSDGVDVFVIGGGINGASVARDAVGRGYSVALAEMNDLASGTSSAATKLVHGGLRYLEHYEFRLVHEALAEREVLWAEAPHIIKPLRFVLPHHKGLRPAMVLRAGLAMYDYMGGAASVAADQDAGPDPRRHRKAAEAGLPTGLRILGLLGR